MPRDTQNIFQKFAALCEAAYNRSREDFSAEEARDAFFKTALSAMRGECTAVAKPDRSTSRDSIEWATYVAARDYSNIGEVFVLAERQDKSVEDRWDSDDSSSDGWQDDFLKAKPRRPSHPRYIDDNGNVFVWDYKEKGYRPIKPHPNKGNAAKMKALSEQGVNTRKGLDDPTTSADDMTTPDESDSISYMERRKKGSRPNKVKIPPIPSYDKENEYIRENIKNSDMLYSYVCQKTGGGVRLSAGLRKYFENNDFWEFAFDTLCAGGWCDSATNRPIANIAKYLTKVIIEEYVAHEATKHSRFENKFKSAEELVEWLHFNYNGEKKEEMSTPEFCAWFLKTMNDCGWRDYKGRPINSIPMELTKQYEKYTEWAKENRELTIGINPNQYEHLMNAQKAKMEGKIKPGANGKYSWKDLQKAMLGQL